MATAPLSVGFSPVSTSGAPSRPMISQTILALIVLFVVISILFAFAWPRIQAEGLVAKSFEKWDQFSLVELLQSPFTWYSGFYERQVQVATGQIATTDVATENLELYLSEIKTLGQQFRPGEEVTAYVTMTSTNLGTQELETSFSCKDSKGSEPELFPGSQFILATKKQDMDCTFSSLENGAHTITIKVGVDYEGITLLPQFFITREIDRELARDELNFFSEFIPDYTGQLYSTSYTGPVDFGLEMQTQPLTIDFENPGKQYPLTMSLENRLGGKFDRIGDIILRLPQGFRLDKVGNAGTPEEITCEDIPSGIALPCSEDLFIVYKIPVNKKDLTRTETFRAILIAENPEGLIANREYSGHEIAAGIDVTYSFERTATIYVKPEEGADVPEPVPEPGEVTN